MAGSVNKVILVGNLGRDPESRSMPSGGEVVNFSVATSENWKDRDGNRQERTEWHNVVIWNENLGRVAKQYLRKGSKVYLEGQLQTRSWQDQSGQERKTTEVVLQRFRGELVLLDRRDGGGGGFGGDDDFSGGYAGGGGGRSDSFGGGRSEEFAGGQRGGGGTKRSGPSFDSDLDDDVPF